jgi:Flp pilus assembly pilin Flp
VQDGAAGSLVLEGRATRHGGMTGGDDVQDLFVRLQVWWGARHRDELGATAVEYALMLALIAMVIVSAVAFLGHSTSNQFASFTFDPA